MAGVPHWIEQGHGAPALLCLHGISGRAEVWRPLLAPLAASGRRVLAWDMPGYGASPAPAHVDMAALAAAVEALLDAAEIERAVLVGHSLGGMIALEAAAHFPERIAALVLACTTPAFGASGGAAQVAFLDERLGLLDRGGSMGELAAGVIPAMLGRDPPPELLAAHCALMATIAPQSYRAAMHALIRFDRRALLAQLRCPVLCLAGAEDRVSTPLVMRRMAGRMSAGVFAELDGAGHLAPFEAPVRFVAELERFLANLS